MKSSSFIVWLLVGAYVAIDLAMIGELQARQNEWPEAGGIIGLALAFSSTTFLAYWVVFGRWNIVLRTVTTVMGLCIASVLASHSADGGSSDSGYWLGFLLLYAGPAIALFVGLRWWGFAFPDQGPAGEPNATPGVHARQFTIWGLLSLTTAIGILLAVIQWAAIPPISLVAIALFVTLLTSSSCCLLLTAMFVRRWWLLGLIALLLLPITGYLLSLTHVAPDDHSLNLIVFSCLLGLIVIAVAKVLQQAGYPLARPPRMEWVTASELLGVSAAGAEDQASEP